MNNEVVKEALSYVLGSYLHEAWRAPRKLEDGTFEPRIKESKDEDWNIMHGTNTVDIANCAFSELPSNWQYENLEAAKVAIKQVFDKVINHQKITPAEIEQMGSNIHDAWLDRNRWVFDKTNGNSNLACAYEKLSKEEQDKDKVQLKLAIGMIEAYLKGLINVAAICEQYNIDTVSLETKNR